MRSLRHPYDSCSSVDDETLRAMFRVLTIGPKALEQERRRTLRKSRRMKEDFKAEDEAIWKRYPSGRRHITKDRSFKLFEAMCVQAGVDDPDLQDLYRWGASLVGEMSDSPQFASQHRPATIDVDDVKAAASWTRPQAMSRKDEGPPSELEKAVWAKTREEVDNKWLRGPYSESEFVAKFGAGAVLARRFGVGDPADVRVIDDVSKPFVNSSFSAPFQSRSGWGGLCRGDGPSVAGNGAAGWHCEGIVINRRNLVWETARLIELR